MLGKVSYIYWNNIRLDKLVIFNFKIRSGHFSLTVRHKVRIGLGFRFYFFLGKTLGFGQSVFFGYKFYCKILS